MNTLNNYIKTIELPVISEAAARQLVAKAQKRGRGGKRAMDLLIRHFARYILNTSMLFRHGAEAAGMGRSELFSDGCMGFAKAVERFDLARTNKLTTYARYWIRAEIGNAKRRKNGSAINGHTLDDFKRVNRHIAKCRAQNDTRPEAEEIAAELDLEEQDVRDLLEAPVHALSLHRPLHKTKGGAETLHIDLLADLAAFNDTTMHEGVDTAVFLRAAKRFLDELPEVERFIFESNAIQGHSHEITAKLVAKKFGRVFKRERSRQILEKVFEKIEALVQNHPCAYAVAV